VHEGGPVGRLFRFSASFGAAKIREFAAMSEGRLYCALPNAFLCRKGLAAGCDSNGNDLVGLASIKPNKDKTLRSSDMIARETVWEGPLWLKS